MHDAYRRWYVCGQGNPHNLSYWYAVNILTNLFLQLIFNILRIWNVFWLSKFIIVYTIIFFILRLDKLCKCHTFTTQMKLLIHHSQIWLCSLRDTHTHKHTNKSSLSLEYSKKFGYNKWNIWDVSGYISSNMGMAPLKYQCYIVDYLYMYLVLLVIINDSFAEDFFGCLGFFS